MKKLKLKEEKLNLGDIMLKKPEEMYRSQKKLIVVYKWKMLLSFAAFLFLKLIFNIFNL